MSIEAFFESLRGVDKFIEGVTPNFLTGLFLGFMAGGAIFSAIVTVSWIWYGERICKKCKKDPDFDENEEI